MPVLTVVKNYIDDTTLTQTQLDQAFQSIETFLNTTKLDSANLQSGAVVTASLAAGAVTSTKIGAAAILPAALDTSVSYQLVPTGSVIPFAGASAPNGFLMCDGAELSRTAYAALFAAIGTAWGTGDGTTTFNIPDMSDSMVMGAGTTYPLATSGGEATHVLTTAELPAHAHGVTDPTHTHHPIGQLLNFNQGGSGGGLTNYLAYGYPDVGTPNIPNVGASATGISINNTGTDTAHNNLPPYMALHHIIKT